MLEVTGDRKALPGTQSSAVSLEAPCRRNQRSSTQAPGMSPPRPYLPSLQVKSPQDKSSPELGGEFQFAQRPCGSWGGFSAAIRGLDGLCLGKGGQAISRTSQGGWLCVTDSVFSDHVF